jgi:SPP1 gp7 family putative phage head morphogenesis protein
MKKSDLSFVSVVSKLKNRVSVKDYYFEKLPQNIRSLAFMVSDLETLRQIELVKRSLNNAIEKGESLETWRDNLDVSVLQSLSNARLETVYRTNVHAVYNQSTRYNAATASSENYLMYDAVGDERTRPEHMQLDGTVKRADSKFWDKYLAPIGYNCRCGVIPLSKSQAKEIGISTRSEDSFPEPEFGRAKMGDILTQVSRETEQAISEMPASSLKNKFKESQDNVRSLVDMWWSKEKDSFSVGDE